jgi:hypothetical protein
MTVEEPRSRLRVPEASAHRPATMSDKESTHVVRLEADCDIVPKLSNVHDVAPRRICKVVRRLAGGSYHVKCML